MARTERDWRAIKRAVGEALDLLPGDRDPHLDARCPDPAQRAEASRPQSSQPRS